MTVLPIDAKRVPPDLFEAPNRGSHVTHALSVRHFSTRRTWTGWTGWTGIVLAALIAGPSVASGDPTPTGPAPTATPAVEIVASSAVGKRIGETLTVTGRVQAVHASPIATVIAFAPNFSGFTATILAEDRGRFPEDLATRLRARTIRVHGPVRAYHGKPEMRLRDPGQLVIVPEPPIPGAEASPSAAVTEIRRLIAELEETVRRLETRLLEVERELALTPPEGTPTPLD